MSENQTETPRTKEVAKMWAEGIDCHHDGRVFCEFAKTLELETQQLQQRVRELEHDLTQATEAVNHLREGKEFGPLVGAHTIVNQQLEIKAKESRIRELETELDSARSGYTAEKVQELKSSNFQFEVSLCKSKERIKELEAENEHLKSRDVMLSRLLANHQGHIEKLEAEVEGLKTAKDHNWNEVLDWERWGKEVTEDFKLPCDQHKVSWRVAITEHMVNLKAEVERLKKEQIAFAHWEGGTKRFEDLQSSHTTLRNAAEGLMLYAGHLPACSRRDCDCGYSEALTALHNVLGNKN